MHDMRNMYYRSRDIVRPTRQPFVQADSTPSPESKRRHAHQYRN